eukprot:Opistho-1_new@19342
MRAVDEAGGVEQGRDFGVAVLGLALGIFGEGHAAARGVARLAEVGGKGGKVVEGDVRGDVDRVGHQEFAQERNLHRLALEVVSDEFAHVARADAVIDGVVEPAARIAEQVRQMCLAKAGHAEEQHAFLARAKEVCSGFVDHHAPRSPHAGVIARAGREFTRKTKDPVCWDGVSAGMRGRSEVPADFHADAGIVVVGKAGLEAGTDVRIGIADLAVGGTHGDLGTGGHGVDRSQRNAFEAIGRGEVTGSAADGRLVADGKRARQAVGELAAHAERVGHGIAVVGRQRHEATRHDVEFRPVTPADRAEDQRVGSNTGLEVEVPGLRDRGVEPCVRAERIGCGEVVGQVRHISQGNAQRDFGAFIGSPDEVAVCHVRVRLHVVARHREGRRGQGNIVDLTLGQAGAQTGIGAESVGEAVKAYAGHLGRGDLGRGAREGVAGACRIGDVRACGLVDDEAEREFVADLLFQRAREDGKAACHITGADAEEGARHGRSDAAEAEFDVISVLEQETRIEDGPFDATGVAERRAAEQGCGSAHQDLGHVFSPLYRRFPCGEVSQFTLV